MRYQSITLISCCQLFISAVWSDIQDWPAQISGSYYEQCRGSYGATSARVYIDTAALTYEQWYRTCGGGPTSWERGTIEKGTTLTKIMLETGLSYEYPPDWRKIEPTPTGSFSLDVDSIVEYTTSGTVFLRYNINNRDDDNR